jgi:hypothetical protein
MTEKSPKQFDVVKLASITKNTPWDSREVDLFRIFTKACIEYGTAKPGQYKDAAEFLDGNYGYLKRELGEKYALFALEFERQTGSSGQKYDTKILDKIAGFKDADNLINCLGDWVEDSKKDDVLSKTSKK